MSRYCQKLKFVVSPNIRRVVPLFYAATASLKIFFDNAIKTVNFSLLDPLMPLA